MTKADVRLEPLYWLLESRALQDKDVVKHFTHTPAPKRTELHDDIQAYIEAERSQHPTTWQQLVIDRLASIFQSRPVLFNRRFRTWLYRLGLMETAVVDNTEWDTASVPDTAELNKILWTAIRWIERLLDGAGLSTVEGLLQSKGVKWKAGNVKAFIKTWNSLSHLESAKAAQQAILAAEASADNGDETCKELMAADVSKLPATPPVENMGTLDCSVNSSTETKHEAELGLKVATATAASKKPRDGDKDTCPAPLSCKEDTPCSPSSMPKREEKDSTGSARMDDGLSKQCESELSQLSLEPPVASNPECKILPKHKVHASTIFQATRGSTISKQQQSFREACHIKGVSCEGTVEGKIFTSTLAAARFAELMVDYIAKQLQAAEATNESDSTNLMSGTASIDEKLHPEVKFLRKFKQIFEEPTLWTLGRDFIRWQIGKSKRNEGFHIDSETEEIFYKVMWRFPVDGHAYSSIAFKAESFATDNDVPLEIPLAAGQGYIGPASLLSTAMTEKRMKEKGLPFVKHSTGDFRGVTYIFWIHPKLPVQGCILENLNKVLKKKLTQGFLESLAADLAAELLYGGNTGLSC